jgi:transcriptional regulator with XRE-family HTH domain
MSFRFDIGARARAASRLIGNIRSDLIAAVVDRRSVDGLSQQYLADLAGVSRQDLNQLLSGQQELTLRSISDIALALNKEVHLELRDPSAGDGDGGNFFPQSQADSQPIARQLKKEVVSSSSTRAMRTFVARVSSNPDN